MTTDDIDNTDVRIAALAAFLACDPDEIEEKGGNYHVGRAEYSVYTDAEADEAVKDDISESLWACNAEFIVKFLRLPVEAIPHFQRMNEDLCEDANDIWKALLGDRLQDFCKQCISTDGRGHYLNNYDGDEGEEGDFFIYRTN